MDLVVPFLTGEDGWDIVDYYLDDLDLLLETCGSREHGANGFLKLLWEREKVVRGGAGNSSELDMVVCSETDLSDKCLGCCCSNSCMY